MAPDIEDIQRIATQEVRYYLQRVSRASTHASDMQQEAIIALLTARRTFNPARGAWSAYASVTARQAVGRYLMKVRGGRRAPALLPLEAADKVASCDDSVEQLNDRRVAARVRSVLNRLDYHPKKVGVANALGEGTPKELAQQSRVPVKDIYFARAQLVRRAAKSLPLQELLEELRP